MRKGDFSNQVQITCPCGQSFGVKKSRSEKAKFCSKPCAYKYRIVHKTKKRGYKINKKKTGPNPNHYLYKGENASYISLHGWVRRHKGKPSFCEHCGIIEGKFQWANKSHEYKRDLGDWISLCIPCHRKHDLDENGNKRRDTYKFKTLNSQRKGKLTDEQIVEIFLSELPTKQLAEKFNVGPGYITRIQTRDRATRITKHLTGIERKPPNQILNEQLALEIFNSPLSGKELAAQYGVSPMTISGIKTGRNWKSATNRQTENI